MLIKVPCVFWIFLAVISLCVSRGLFNWFKYSGKNVVDKRVKEMNLLLAASIIAPITAIPVAYLANAWLSVLWCAAYIALLSVSARCALLVTGKRLSRRIKSEDIWQAVSLRLNLTTAGVFTPLISSAAFILFADTGVAFVAGIIGFITELALWFVFESRGREFWQADMQARGYTIVSHTSPSGGGHLSAHKAE